MIIEGKWRNNDRTVLIAASDIREGLNRIKVENQYYDINSDAIRRCLKANGVYSIPTYLLRPAVGNI